MSSRAGRARLCITRICWSFVETRALRVCVKTAGFKLAVVQKGTDFIRTLEFGHFREVASHVILSEAKNLALGVRTRKQ